MIKKRIYQILKNQKRQIFPEQIFLYQKPKECLSTCNNFHQSINFYYFKLEYYIKIETDLWDYAIGGVLSQLTTLASIFF